MKLILYILLIILTSAQVMLLSSTVDKFKRDFYNMINWNTINWPPYDYDTSVYFSLQAVTPTK